MSEKWKKVAFDILKYALGAVHGACALRHFTSLPRSSEGRGL